MAGFSDAQVVFQEAEFQHNISFYSVEQGLSDRDVRGIVKDRQGYLWIATANGLNRFDGYEFLQFDNSANNPHKITSNLINNIFLDRSGQIILNNAPASMDRIDPVSGRRTVIPLDSTSGFYGAPGCFWQDKAGAVYGTGFNNNICHTHLFNEQNGRFERLFSTPLQGPARFPTMIRASDGTYWILYLGLQYLRTYLHHLDAQGKVLQTFEQKDFAGTENNKRMYNILENNEGKIWCFVTGNGMFEAPAGHPVQFTRHPHICQGTYYCSSDTLGNTLLVSVLPTDKNGSVLFTGDGKMLDYSFVDKDQQSRGVRVGHFSTIFSENFHYNFFVCSIVGFTKFHIVQRNITSFVSDQSGKHLFRSVRGMAKMGADKLLIATDENFLFEFDLQNENITSLTDRILAPGTQRGGFYLLRSLIPQGDSIIWITATGGLYKYHIARNSLNAHKTSQPFRDENLIGIMDTDGATLILPSNNGLMFVRTSDGAARIYTNKDGSNPIYDTAPSFILKAKNGIVWVGTTKIGLVRIDLDAGTSTVYDEHAGFNSKEISLVFEDAAGQLWVGTINGGLHLFDPAQGKVTACYTRENGLPHNSIAGMLPAANGNYWVSTYNGLSLFDTGRKTFRNYTVVDGLAHNEFNRYSFFYDQRSGRYFFGGLNGINTFFEDDLKPEVNRATVLITKITRPDAEGVLQTQFVNITDGMTITVPAAHRTLHLRLALAHFDFPEGNRFSYLLEGIDKQWNLPGADRELRFNHLPTGVYTLRIRGADSRGNWSTDEMTLRIEVQQYWYWRWWALLLYLLLLGSGGYILYRFRLKQKLAARETQRLQELDAFKSRFFTNITHEFRTPLTVILGNAELMDKELERHEKENAALHTGFFKPKVALVKRSGENLLRLINEILDLAKLENNSLSLNYSNGDLLAYLRYIAESMHSLANTRNIMLRVESTEASLLMDYDPERLLQIVHNLLSNAIKFTPSGGRVTLRLTLEANPVPTAVISVADTGIGIPPEELAQVFDRFFQAKNQEYNKTGGSGIGLSLTRELVKAMDGSITAESTPGAGTVFTVKLPVRQQAATTQPVSADTFYSPEKKLQPQTANTPPADTENGLPQILIIEDNPDVVEYLSACLQQHYRLEYAFNGSIGIEKALENTPDLIISDVMMPEKDGLDVCDILKNDVRSSHIPLILLTARADMSSRIAGLRRGADVYLAKPFNREELLAHISNLLEMRRKLQQRYAGMGFEYAPLEAESPVQNMEDAFIIELRALIEKHIDDPKLNPDFICQKLGMSRTNLHRKITALTSLPLTMFVRNLRLQKARTLLQTTDMNVSEVAFAVGIDDPKYFSRIFSETFGVPPSTVKK